MSRRYHCYSKPGQGKTAFACSGGKTWYGEFDPGSFERAEHSGIFSAKDVSVFYYPQPIDLRNRGTISTSMAGANNRGPVFVSRRLAGYDELFTRFGNDYMDAIDGGDYNTFVIDTQTKLHETVVKSYQQRIQDEVDDKRERLQRAEYQEVTSLMDGIINLPRTKGCDLVLVSHIKEIWRGGAATGEFGPDGWNKIDDYSDCTLEFVVDNKKPVAFIRKSGGGGLELVGMRIPEPTLPKVNELLDAAAKLRDAKKVVPGKYEDVLVQAAVL